MGVETPIPPKEITAAAPDGAPPRRIFMIGCEPYRFMLVSPEQKNLKYSTRDFFFKTAGTMPVS
jgi:hypothetical protein